MLRPLRISLLGSVTLERDDKPLTGLTAVKAQALLIYLAVTGRPHTRSALAGLLWSDAGETAAHNSLRVTLAHLRQAAGDYIAATRQTIGLGPESAVWLDVTHFLQACSRLQIASASIEEGEYQALRSAVHLYRGDFLAGFHVPNAELFDEWVVVERAYYSRLAIEALSRLATIGLERSAMSWGIEDARRAMALDPLLEEAHRLLMQLYAYNGQTPQALRQYDECVRLLDQELGVPPADETVALYTAIRARTLSTPLQIAGAENNVSPMSLRETGRRPRHNLPHQTTPFVGRTAELAALDELLAAPDRRLVTIVAPGGMGKTRLAQEAALAQLEHFDDGIYFVPLAPVSRADELAPAIADAVNYPMQADSRSPQEQLLDFLRRRQMLLVLDNFEHLLEGAALVNDILQAASAVKILVTSRERIRLTSEHILSLAGLELPSGPMPVLMDGSDAVELFVQHARRVAPDFTLSEENWPAVAEICRFTAGMPLGIVLAAAWISLLSADEIATEIAHNLDFLEADLRDLPERQRSLASVFEHTWQRLLLREHAAFMRLAVFRNGFSRQAAQVVAAASPKLLLNLVDKALIQRNAAGRYEVHELLRQYGLRMLDRAGAADAARDAHSRYFLQLLHTLEADVKGRRQLAALEEIEADLDNVRAAWAWALARREYRLVDGAVEAFYLFFALRGRSHEGTEILWRTYQDLGIDNSVEFTATLRARVLVRFCLVQSLHYRDSRAIDDGLALAQAEASGDETEIAAYWFALGRREQLAACEGQRPTFDGARRYLEQSLACFRSLGDYFFMARAAELIGDCYGYNYATMDLFQAFYAMALDFARQAGSVMDEAHILAGLGWASIDLGHYAEAEHYYREAEALSSRLHSIDTIAYVKLGWAFVDLAQGRMETARRLAQEGMILAREFNATSNESVALFILSLLASMGGDNVTARQLAEQSLRTSPVRYFRSYTDWSLAIAHCGLGNGEMAWRYLRSSLETLRVDSAFSRLLAVAAVLLGQQGNDEGAVEVLGSVYSDPRSARGWMEQWRPLTKERARLQSHLGAIVFQRLWDRGSALDTAALAEDLLGSAA